MITDGLYLSIDDNGNIERYLLVNNEKIELDSTTVKDEIIEFSEYNLEPYADLMETVCDMANKVMNDNFDFEKLYTLAYDICDELSKENSLFGELTRTLLDDNVGYEFSLDEIIVDAASQIAGGLQEVIVIYNMVHQYLYHVAHDLPVDVQNDYQYLSNVAVEQIISLDKTLYHFRSLFQYIAFIMICFIKKEYTVKFCECCGRYFIPKTKSKTIYCDRIIRENKTCKQIAPKLKQKKMAEDDPVIREYERIKNTLRKRVERTENFGGGDKCMSYDEYYNWLKAASPARIKYLNGDISAEDALKIFNDFE